MIEGVLSKASRVVEVRIAQFRAILAIFLLLFTAQYQMQTAHTASSTFIRLGLVASLFALAFSGFVILSNKRKTNISVTVMAICSIGLDATLMVLPVSLFFSTPETPSVDALQAGVLLNQPVVFAMYLLVIASGLRFYRVAWLGITVNSLIITSLMFMEALSTQYVEGFRDVSILAIKQHILLLLCSAFLAFMISNHTRVTTQKAAQAALHATTDALTGAFNRHYLREKLEEFWPDTNRSVHLIIVDADHFKSINDTLGHVVGDRVLVEVARRLQAALRPTDLLARFGGEEFCIVLTDIDDVIALTVAERLRKAIAGEPMQNRKVTVSVGLSRRVGGETIASLMSRADRALYRSKEEGRNRVSAEWPEGIPGLDSDEGRNRNVS